ncbi:MAG: hypothetical protein U9P12_04890 [Verrucomicrobiota bacterium]|nr:hypothetical protein [Verrucomicrobiota bacterium]
MKQKMKVLFTCVFALSVCAISQATLVGSLHTPHGQTTSGSDWLTGIHTRTASGNANTRGTVQGDLSLLAGATTGVDDYVGIGISGSWMAATRIGDYNRRASATAEAGGASVYDFDVSGISSNAWEMKIDYSNRRTTCEESGLYISFTGLGRTLDTTDVTNLSVGTAGTLVSDPTKYVKIGSLPAATESGIHVWDLTEIIEAAQSNGGLVRVVYTDNGYKDATTWMNDTGLIATDSTTGTPVEVSSLTTLLADDFDVGVSSNSLGTLINGWVGSGPEPKEYNVASSGILDIRDHDNEEKGTNTQHAGYFDSVEIPFSGVVLTNLGDWIQLSLDIGHYVDDSGAPMHTGLTRFRVSLTEEGLTNAAGYGFLLAHGSETESQVTKYDNKGAYVSSYFGTIDYDHPDDGTLIPLRLKMVRVAGGLELSASWNGMPMGNVINDYAADNRFNLLNLSLTTMDVGCKIDNVRITSNLELGSSYSQWAADSGLDMGVNDDPTDNPDGDGLNNLYEYGLGGDPTNGADQGISPAYVVTMDGGTNWFTYVYPKRSSAESGIAYHLETDTDLVLAPGWTNGNYEVLGTWVTGGEFNYVTNRVSTDGEAQQFIQLIIEEVP